MYGLWSKPTKLVIWLISYSMIIFCVDHSFFRSSKRFIFPSCSQDWLWWTSPSCSPDPWQDFSSGSRNKRCILSASSCRRFPPKPAPSGPRNTGPACCGCHSSPWEQSGAWKRLPMWPHRPPGGCQAYLKKLGNECIDLPTNYFKASKSVNWRSWALQSISADRRNWFGQVIT